MRKFIWVALSALMVILTVTLLFATDRNDPFAARASEAAATVSTRPMSVEAEPIAKAARLEPSDSAWQNWDSGPPSAATLSVPPFLGEIGAPRIHGRSGILIDTETGTILYRKNATEEIAPASLTKLVTIYTAMRMIDRGKMRLSDTLMPPRAAWAQNMPRGSSLMFLGPDQRVSVYELLMGLAVPSGNDAAIALAIHSAGSVESYATAMNREMAALGLSELRFNEPSGLSPKNTVTARHFAAFVRAYLAAYPENLDRFHAVQTMRYPTADNYPRGIVSGNGVLQQNRNGLLWDYEGADGLKTGYIAASDYNIAATAERNGMRLAAVVLGVESTPDRTGSALREADAAALLDWGFEQYQTVELALPALDPVRVWYGGRNEIPLRFAPDAATMTVPRNGGAPIEARVKVPGELFAPIERHVPIGTVELRRGTTSVGSLRVYSGLTVREGPPVIRLWHTIAEPLDDLWRQLRDAG
jgi:D-alanyl-D-alanine carboxypeptidase (penicillin-binding protein 5/6)